MNQPEQQTSTSQNAAEACAGREARSPKVAVVAVHGIGRHAAGETQNTMADLLLSLPTQNHNGPRVYEPFRSVGLQIPLQPLITPKLPARKPATSRIGNLLRKLWDTFDERSTIFAKGLPKKVGGVPVPGDVSTLYTDLLLDKYEGGADSNAYITTRLETTRGTGGPEVHVYEVFWSDLAKPDSSILTFFVALFQLLLHLASLSRLAIDTGAAETTGVLWKIYRGVQRYAVRIVQIFIPLLEVVLFISIGSCMIGNLSSGLLELAVLMGGAGGTGIAFLIVNSGKWPVNFGPRRWTLLALLPGAAGSGLAYWLVCATSPAQAAALLVWIVPGAVVMYWILSNYEEVRSGAETTGWILYGFGFAAFASFLISADRSVASASFLTAEVLLAAVRLSWGLLILCALAALILGAYAWRWSWPKMQPGGEDARLEQKARARAAVRTSRLALALPAVLFMLVTVLMWSGFTKVAGTEARKGLATQAADRSNGRVMCWLESLDLLPSNDTVDPSRKAEDGTTYVADTLAWSVGYQLPVTLALLGVAGFLMLWWALPSVLTERFPPRNKEEAPRAVPDDISVHMGSWLSRGLDATAAVTMLTWSAAFLTPVLYLVLSIWDALYGNYIVHACLQFLQKGTVVLIGGYMLAGATVLAALAKGGQTVLSTLLDVDTYLRATPEEATPRAKIFERYISTLRYLNDPAHGYDSVVIVAHSLGALISGDILHYMAATNRENLAVPMRLLTMGNPTRQLLNRFFPYLYDWVRATPDNGAMPLPSPTQKVPEPAIDGNTGPFAADLGLVQWVSAYRSGDYVGRSVWLDEWFWRDKVPAPVSLAGLEIVRSADCDRAELCIGAGAHTHYMDDTAPEIAWLLDSLIVSGQV